MPFLAGEILYDVSGESKVMCTQYFFEGGKASTDDRGASQMEPSPTSGPGGLVGEEDCLLLNIYTPAGVSGDLADRLPVMVWIHGGSLLTGSNMYSSYGPQLLLDRWAGRGQLLQGGGGGLRQLQTWTPWLPHHGRRGGVITHPLPPVARCLVTQG